MAQNTVVEAAQVRRYTRADFTALRFRLNGISLEAIQARFYQDEDLAERRISSPSDMGQWLKALQAMLVERALKTNPLLAQHLAHAAKTNRWAPGLVNFLVAAGEENYAKPRPNDTLIQWFKPLVVSALKAENIKSPAQLKAYVELRGEAWYRAIPRIGKGKAATLQRWLIRNRETLGDLVLLPSPAQANGSQLELHATSGPLIPLERISRVTSALDGSQGVNRNNTFCLISAANDLEALHAYLYRFRGRDKTVRAYRKELERFLLWCVRERHTALASVLTRECEDYKDFLVSPAHGWVGGRAARSSSAWRPFAGPLSAESQRYAVQVLRGFFEWLVKVRYLAGNPWITVADPQVELRELEMAIDKALPQELWLQVVGPDGLLARACDATPTELMALHSPGPGGALPTRDVRVRQAQYRLARAAILLMGFSGLRREEAAGATRDKLKPVRERAGDHEPLWELAVLGKRKKWRTVFLPYAVVQALRLHWEDRGHDFGEPSAMALLAPVTVARHQAYVLKHVDPDSLQLNGSAFSPDSLYRVVKKALTGLARDPQSVLTSEERAILELAAPHALRHTFATLAAAKEMPTDVLQRLLGHVSSSTTSIYVRAERQRSIDEVSKLFRSS